MSVDEYARSKLKDLEILLTMKHQVIKKTNLTFGEALKHAKQDKRIGRWHRDDIYVYLEKPQPALAMDLPYLKVCTANGEHTVWCPNHADLLADNWRVIDNETDK